MSGLLTVIYGGPDAPRAAVARELARLLPGKTAVVSVPTLLDAIAQPDTDVAAELDLVHIQLRLLVANYLKAGYHVIAEAGFIYERDGTLVNFDNDIDQLAALMRNLATATKVVQLRIDGPDPHKARFGTRYMQFNPGEAATEVAASIRDALKSETA